jgi:hypothetical protein
MYIGDFFLPGKVFIIKLHGEEINGGMMEKKPKSNKLKKEFLRKKAEGKAILLEKIQAEIEASARKTYRIPKKTRNLSEAIQVLFKEQKAPPYSSPLRNLYNEAFGHPLGVSTLQWLKECCLLLVDLDVDFLRSHCKVLVNIAKLHDQAIRPLKDYKLKSHNTDKQIIGLVRHLFTKYTVPAFFDKVWYLDNITHQKWFIHVGIGNNIRKVEYLPIALTKKEAHFMMQAPRDFDIFGAIRYGQVLNIGGNEMFVRQVLRTRMGQDFSNNEFWLSVFRWFLQNPMLDSHHYASIIDYIFNQKYVASKLDESGRMISPQPNLSMKDREPEILLRQVEAWHRRLGKENKGPQEQWRSSGFAGLYHETGKDEDKVVYTIREICTKAELTTEGRTMHHCVVSYSMSCARGRSSIWTLEETTIDGIKKLLTVEVNNQTRTIVQARGKYNSKPSVSEMRFLHLWSTKAGLTISSWLI